MTVVAKCSGGVREPRGGVHPVPRLARDRQIEALLTGGPGLEVDQVQAEVEVAANFRLAILAMSADGSMPSTR